MWLGVKGWLTKMTSLDIKYANIRFSGGRSENGL
jgi:hypothetical protein